MGVMGAAFRRRAGSRGKFRPPLRDSFHLLRDRPANLRPSIKVEIVARSRAIITPQLMGRAAPWLTLVTRRVFTRYIERMF